ncbi:MAG: hypothetical protein WAM17_18410 [Rhodoplanes sp.]
MSAIIGLLSAFRRNPVRLASDSAGMSNAGILAALTLGIIGIIAGGVVGGIAAFVLTVGLVIAAYVVPIVLLVALLIYAFSK